MHGRDYMGRNYKNYKKTPRIITGISGSGDCCVDGLSAYEVAVENGFFGTEREWLASLQGEVGPAGPQGEAGQPGSTGPQGPKGDDGRGLNIKGALTDPSELPVPPDDLSDAYMIDGDLWQWNLVTNEWVTIGHIQGPEGPIGPTGETGPQGAIGPQGPQGLVGQQGAVGPQGPQGETGARGVDGFTVHSGIAVPGSALGNIGDLYIQLPE